MRRVTTLVAVAAVATMALTACSGSDSTSTATSGGAEPAAASIKVGLAYDIGGRGDKSFNDSAAAGLDKAKNDLGIEIKELSANQGETDADKEARLKLLAQGGYNPVIAVGFLYGASSGQGRAAVPGHPVRHRRLPRCWGRDQRHRADLRRERGFLPGRRRRGAEVHDRQRRLHRRLHHPADPEVRGRLRRGRQGGEPGHQGPGEVHLQPAGLQGLQRPGRRDRGGERHVRRRRGHRLPRRRRLRHRCLPGRQGQGQAGHRGRQRPVRDGLRRPQAGHPDLDAEAGRRRGLRHDQVCSGG